MLKFSGIVGVRPSNFSSYDAFTNAIVECKDMGYDGVEFCLGNPLGFEPEKLHDFLLSINFPVSNMLTGLNAMDDGLWLSVADDDIRNRAIKRLQEVIPVAKKLNSATMVIGTMQGNVKQEPNREVGKARILEGLKRVAETAEKYNQIIVLEPMNHIECGYGWTYDEVMDTIKQIGSKCFKPMLDTFHMLIEEKDIIETFRKAGNESYHVHLCDTNARVAGTGSLDYVGILTAIKEMDYQHWITVKCYREPWPSGARDSIKYIRSLGIV